MIYLDHSATSFPKPEIVKRAVLQTMERCTNPSRGGHEAALAADRTVFRCREAAAAMFDCLPEQVVLTPGCTYGLNMAIKTLAKPGHSVLISGFEHNAVTRPLHTMDVKLTVAGRTLFRQDDTLEQWEKALRQGVDVAVFTHVSNVFGYILPVMEMAQLCNHYGVPFIVDAAQSAGCLPVQLKNWGASFVAMPGHKGLLGPQGVGLLLCGRNAEPLVCGGTGSASQMQGMPDDLPERAEAGTLNVPGIGGLLAGIRLVEKMGTDVIFQKEQRLRNQCVQQLQQLGLHVFSGPQQSGVVSFVSKEDCEELARYLAQHGIAVRAGLHCAPLAHESAGTLQTGTVRISFGHNSTSGEVQHLVKVLQSKR